MVSDVDLSAVDFSDVDAGNGPLTVTLSTGPEGQLTASSGGGVTVGGTVNARTFTGSQTDLNAFFNVASNIQYVHGTANTNGNDADTITVVVNDNGNTGTGGGADQTLGTVNVDITAVNDEEVLATNAGATVIEGSTGNIITSAQLQTTDVDNTDAELVYTVDVVPGNGTLRLNGTALIVNDTFTQADIDANRLTYDHNGLEDPTDSFDFTVDDGAGTNTSDTFDFTITAVNDAPVVADPRSRRPWPTPRTTVPWRLPTRSPSAMSTTPISNRPWLQITGGFVTGEDVLTFTTQNGITGTFNSANGTLSLSGTATLAEYEAAIRSVTYTNTSDDPNTSDRTVSFTVNDGDVDSNTQSRDIALTAVNDAPVAADIETTDVAYTENGGAVGITNAITFGDLDDTDLESAVVQITGGFVTGEDVLTFTTQNGITGTFDDANGTLSLSGTATLAEYETAIRSITYTSTSDDPSTATRTVSFTVNDGEVDSNTQARDIAIEATNDDPTNAGTLPSDVTVHRRRGLERGSVGRRFQRRRCRQWPTHRHPVHGPRRPADRHHRRWRHRGRNRHCPNLHRLAGGSQRIFRRCIEHSIRPRHRQYQRQRRRHHHRRR